ncbi:SDR family oxidoreductase [Rahnella aquatilis]|uniref:SDR family oxidoreductase n=1 Tax=Rahnella aquatilis TaxID=34038 RepID=UPI0006478F0B|nr:SDR family NAD(P)-dependent oxidoreductase [Rahnella aquatilis]
MNTRKWILITGGSRGIGKALVIRLSKKYDIVFTWNTNADQAQSVEKDCADTFGEVRGYCCDGRNEEQVSLLARLLLTERGAPYCIIHNAGITRDALHIKQTSADWHDVINTNLNAIFHWNQHLLPPMLARGEGSVIMMSSVSAQKGNVGQVAYSATKAAMTGITRSLALEVARFGIRVNSLLPGVIETEMTAALRDEERKALRSHIPLRRLGKADEIAQMADFLLSESGSYITGQSIIIDGGLSA